jgi:hypothetical protein
MSEWLKETGCKPVGYAYAGSNPAPPILGAPCSHGPAAWNGPAETSWPALGASLRAMSGLRVPATFEIARTRIPPQVVAKLDELYPEEDADLAAYTDRGRPVFYGRSSATSPERPVLRAAFRDRGAAGPAGRGSGTSRRPRRIRLVLRAAVPEPRGRRRQAPGDRYRARERVADR